MEGHAGKGQETPLATLYRHFEQALEQNSIELALANVPVEDIRADVAPHLESLATWYHNQSATLWDMPVSYRESSSESGETKTDVPQIESLVRAGTFLLAPEL